MYLSEAITGQLQKTYLCKQCPATLGAQKKVLMKRVPVNLPQAGR